MLRRADLWGRGVGAVAVTLYWVGVQLWAQWQKNREKSPPIFHFYCFRDDGRICGVF